MTMFDLHDVDSAPTPCDDLGALDHQGQGGLYCFSRSALFRRYLAILINNDEDISPSSSQWVFPTTLAIGGLVTYIDSKRAKPLSDYGSPSKGWDRESDETMKRIGIPLWVGALIFLLWAGLLILVIVLVDVIEVENDYLKIFEVMYRIGSITFGGGGRSFCPCSKTKSFPTG